MAETAETVEFTRVSVEDAAQDLSVTLRRRGIHRDAKINVEVRPPVTDAEIVELKAQGHLDEDARVTFYDRATDMNIGSSERDIEPQNVETAVGIAETLARLREVDSARVSVMRNFTFGECGEYLDSTILLVRQQQ